jgi:hypothetical protein
VYAILDIERLLDK